MDATGATTATPPDDVGEQDISKCIHCGVSILRSDRWGGEWRHIMRAKPVVYEKHCP